MSLEGKGSARTSEALRARCTAHNHAETADYTHSARCNYKLHSKYLSNVVSVGVYTVCATVIAGDQTRGGGANIEGEFHILQARSSRSRIERVAVEDLAEHRVLLQATRARVVAPRQARPRSRPMGPVQT